MLDTFSTIRVAVAYVTLEGEKLSSFPADLSIVSGSSWRFMFPCLLRNVARQMYGRLCRVSRLANLHEGGTDMVSPSIASTKLCRLHRVIDRRQGVLPKDPQSESACPLNLIGCLYRNWPRSRGHDLSGLILHTGRAFISGNAYTLVVRAICKLDATLPCSLKYGT